MKELIKYIMNKGIYDGLYINCFFTYEGVLGLLNIIEENSISISMIGVGFYKGEIFEDYWESLIPTDRYNYRMTTREIYDFLNFFKLKDDVYFEIYFDNKKINECIDLIFGI